MDEASSKSGLLALPIEVREHILSYCIQETWDAPEMLYTAQPQLFWCEPLATLLVNKQLHHETSILLEHLRETSLHRPLHAELHLIVVGMDASVRWTSLSRALGPLSPCDLTIRLMIVSTEAFQPQPNERDISSYGCWSLSDILLALHRSGPRALSIDCQSRLKFPRNASTRLSAFHGRDFKFRNLSFVVSFNDCYTRATHAQVVDEIFEWCEGLAMNAEWFGIIGQIKAVADYTQEQHGGGSCVVHREDGWKAKFTSNDAWKSLADE